MGEDFKQALASVLIKQERRISMLEIALSTLLHGLEEKQIMTSDEIDDLFDSAQELTEIEVKDRLEQVREAFGLTVP
jgi:hypothetical protein